MDSDDIDLRAQTNTARQTGKNLEDMSIESIGAYIAVLKNEISRAEAAIEAKKIARSGADAVFKR